GDRVFVSLAVRQQYGVYDIKDFKPGVGGDILSVHGLLVELSANGFDSINPLIDLQVLSGCGQRQVTGTNSWMRLRQDGADTLVEVDPTGPGNGSDYLTIAILRNVNAAALHLSNFDPP